MFGDYVPGAPGLLDDYFKANPLSWLNFDQSTPVDKIKQNQLTNTLLTVGGALSAAGAKSYDPGHSAKAMAGLGQGLQNVQQGAFDQVQGLQDQQDREEMFSWQKAKYDADMAHKLKVFGWDMEQKAQEIKAKAEAAKRAQMESDRNYGLARDKFDYQQGQDARSYAIDRAKLNQPLSKAGKIQADIDAGFIPEGTAIISNNDAFDNEHKLRGEFGKHAGEFVKLRDSYTRISASLEDPSPAGDLALIFNYMKMLDPGSVVREGEFATAQNAGGVDDKVQNVYNSIIHGERLTPEQRRDFALRANSLYEGQQRHFSGLRNRYTGLAERYGLDPQNVVYDIGSTTPSLPKGYLGPRTPLGVPSVTNSTGGGNVGLMNDDEFDAYAAQNGVDFTR